MDTSPLRRIKVELLNPGDIVLTATTGKTSKRVRLATKGAVSHAMICVQHGSTIDSTDDGVQASNIQRDLYGPEDTVFVLRLREPISDVHLNSVLDFARSEIGTRYSKSEAIRTVLKGPKPRTRQMFCSRLVARAFAAGGVQLVRDPDYCSPEELRSSPLLSELSDMTEDVSEAELAAWDARPDPIAETHRAQNAILDAARMLDPSIENFNDLDAFVQTHPEHDEAIAGAYRESGYLDLWRVDFEVNPWHYDLALMVAMANGQNVEDLRQYCVSTIAEFHTGGLRFAINLAHYEHNAKVRRRRTTEQLVTLYQRLVKDDQTRRNVALGWLRRHCPTDAKEHLQRVVPHSDLWFSMVDRVEPRLAAAARMVIGMIGNDACCSACGDPAEDYLLVNSAEAMPGVPSLRLCKDCVQIRRASGEVLEPIGE